MDIRKEFCYNIYIQVKGSDVMTVAEKNCLDEKVQEIQIFKELDKGIDDMEAGRVIEHDETMRILKERVKQYAL